MDTHDRLPKPGYREPVQLHLPHFPQPMTRRRMLDICPKCRTLHTSADVVRDCREAVGYREQA